MSYYLFSLGCKVNSYELDALRETLAKRGEKEAATPEEADLIVINTCSVTATADQKSRQHVRKFRRLAPNATLVVMGCYSELHAQEALTMGADIVIGTSDRAQTLADWDRFQKDRKKIVDVKPNVRQEGYEEMGQMALADNTRAYLKIQDGCDNFCSYCLIPYLRGNSRSRPAANALAEAHRLAEAGYREIVIAGIHIGFYGKDLGDGSYRLGNLLDDLLKENPTLFRLRISSLEESEIDDRVLALLKNHANVANHLHIPLQSGSSAVLKRMRRKYDTAAFLETLRKIREIRPDIAITTDVIVGFPGESAEEWAETMAFCQKAAFAEIHVFPFSAREGTPAFQMKDTDAATKEKRVHELLALSASLREEYEKTYFGREVEVLYENDKEGFSYGHASNYLLVKTPSAKPLRGHTGSLRYGPDAKAD
jgi:threonylcarbamoyladenosine tRNA methylthiotransferase MtaB